MRTIDRSTARVVALIVLLVVAGAALHGYVPSAASTSRRQVKDSPAALVVVMALLGASLVIIAVAIIGRLRDRRAAATGIRVLPAGPDGDRTRPSWRVLLIGLAALVAWLLIVWLLMRLFGQHGFSPPARMPRAHTDAPGTVHPPDATALEPQRPLRPQLNSGRDMLGYLVTATAAMLLLTAAAAAIAVRGRPDGPKLPARTDAPGVPPVTGPESLARAAELGLAQIGDLSREPREAIIGCYATMERELAHVPDAVPQDYDTPTEVLTRAVDHHALPAGNARQLVNLFAEARFSPHLMTEQHRADAVRILRLVLAELQTPT